MLYYGTKKDDKYVIPLSLDDDRVIGIKFEINRDNSTFLFQVYLPCTNHPIDMFKEYLDRLQNILSLYSEKGTVVLMGDFNAYLHMKMQYYWFLAYPNTGLNLINLI